MTKQEALFAAGYVAQELRGRRAVGLAIDPRTGIWALTVYALSGELLYAAPNLVGIDSTIGAEVSRLSVLELWSPATDTRQPDAA